MSWSLQSAFTEPRFERGGLGQVSGMAAWVWRALFTLLVLCAGTGVPVYLLLWILVPETEPRHPAPAGRTAAG